MKKKKTKQTLYYWIKMESIGINLWFSIQTYHDYEYKCKCVYMYHTCNICSLALSTEGV